METGEERLGGSHEPGGKAARRKEDGTAQLGRVKPRAPRKPLEFAAGPELCSSPRARTEPTSDAALGSPHAEATKLTEDDATARDEHTSHLANGKLGIRHEAEHCHCDDHVEGGIVERQLFGAPLSEGHVDSARGSTRTGCVEHLLLEAERRDDGPAPRGLDRVGAVAGPDVEHALAAKRAEKIEDDVRLHALGDVAE